MWKEITMLSFPSEFAAPESHWHKVGTESKIVELVFEICNAYKTLLDINRHKVPKNLIWGW